MKDYILICDCETRGISCGLCIAEVILDLIEENQIKNLTEEEKKELENACEKILEYKSKDYDEDYFSNWEYIDDILDLKEPEFVDPKGRNFWIKRDSYGNYYAVFNIEAFYKEEEL